MRKPVPIELRPTAGPLAELTEEELSDFIWCLGWIAFRSIPTAAYARHGHPLNSIIDYLDIYPTDVQPVALAKEFLRDLAGNLGTEELAKKWYGKDVGTLSREVSELVSQMRKAP